MLKFVAGRFLVSLAVAFTISFVTFFFLNIFTDPAQAVAGEEALFEEIEQIRTQYGFDRPILTRYFEWLGGIFTGDFGVSYYWNKPVGTLLLERAPQTIKLALMSVSVTIMVAIPLGIFAALNPNSIIDRFALSVAVSAQAIPNFWLGLILIIIFSVTFPIFPVSGDKTYYHFILPSLVLGTSSVPPVMRLMRTGLLDVINSDYIRTARSIGFSGWRLVTKHALRNAVLPIISVIAVQLGHKFGGSLITESVFRNKWTGTISVTIYFGSGYPNCSNINFCFCHYFYSF